ncbi:hypothetical protein BKH43_08025 [Helicobacter sp. 13S00401-1]|nr:hypothetical protein BKH43_08025 [Helicobacter sp. 13S00401-1]
MGSFGSDFASFNLSLFGYLAYIYLPLLLYPLFRIYKNSSYSFRKVELTLGYLVLFVSLLILQAVSFKKGDLALSVVHYLLPYIGLFGIVIACIFGLLISYVLISARGFFILSSLVSKAFHKIALWLGSVRKLLATSFSSFSDFSFGGFFTSAFSRKKSAFVHEEGLKEEDLQSFSSFKEEDSNKNHSFEEPYRQENIESKEDKSLKKSFSMSFLRPMKEDNRYESEGFLVRKIETTSLPKTKLNLSPLKIDYEPRTTDNLGSQDEKVLHALSDMSSPYPYEDFTPVIEEEKDKEGLVTFIPKPLKIESSISSQEDRLDGKDSLDEDKVKTKDFSLEETLNEARALKEALLERQDADLEELKNLEASKKEQALSDVKAPKVETDLSTLKTKKDVVTKESKNLEGSTTYEDTFSASKHKQDYFKSANSSLKIETKQSMQTKEVSKDMDTKKDEHEALKDSTSNLKNPESKSQAMPAVVTSLSENESFIKDAKDGASLKNIGYKLPPLSLLQEPKFMDADINEQEIDSKIRDLISKLSVFKIRGDVVRVYSGPVVTTFEFRPDPDIKVTKILSLQDDLAMTLKAKSLRMQAPIPGKDVVGIEIPNSVVQTIYLKEILESKAYKESKGALTVALGKDIVGNPFIANLEKLPHLLVAGTTGSGKSVGVSSIIISLLYRNSPDNLKFIMIDPKKVEFEPYEDIPHLITPIINNPEKAVLALAAATREMDKRYDALAKLKCKNIASFNEKSDSKMPFLVIVIDELADLIMTGGKDVEFSIARIAQMGRACGMHLIVATQRSSTDVVTGLIKTNLPSRISYKVGNRIDSKVILDAFGAERLLGNGDGLFTPPGGGLVRIHAPWISEKEIEDIINYIKDEREVVYDDDFLGEDKASQNVAVDRFTDPEGEKLLEAAKEVILSEGKTSISFVQRRLGIGYNKAASLMEALEAQGFLSSPNSKNERSIL